MFENDLGSYSSSSSDNLEDNITNKCCLANNTNNGNANALAGTFSNEETTKIAEIIEIKDCDTVHIGNKINITERIELKCDNGQLPYFRDEKNYDMFFSMVRRGQWLAQPSEPVEKLKEPAKYVIICHSVTKESFTQAENVLTLRVMQGFQMETWKWPDIAYNFCIGSDGNVYEGRGWLTVNESTLPYHTESLTIAFMGRFQSHLPPKTAFKRCKEVIEYAVKIGAVRPDYKLLAHCQCIGGFSITDEVKSWENFSSISSPGYPCTLLPKNPILAEIAD